MYEHNWKIHQNTMYLYNFRVAQSKGLQRNRPLQHIICDVGPGHEVRSRITQQRPRTKSRVPSIQRASEGNDQQHGKHEVLRDLRDHSQNTVPQLADILAERYCILHMQNMLKTFRQSYKTQQRSLRCFVDSQLRTSSRKTHLTGHVTGTQAKKCTHQFWIDSRIALFIERSQMDIGWTEDHCARLDEIAAEDHSYIATAAERHRRENT